LSACVLCVVTSVWPRKSNGDCGVFLFFFTVVLPDCLQASLTRIQLSGQWRLFVLVSFIWLRVLH